MAKQPGAVESHWIPMDKELWKTDNYLDFLAARRELLAKAANEFLDSLLVGVVPEVAVSPAAVEVLEAVVPGAVESEEEEAVLRQCNEWVADQGLPEGEYSFELVDPDTSQVLAVLDLVRSTTFALISLRVMFQC